jgi:predicted dinucleotide-binding enzyme
MGSRNAGNEKAAAWAQKAGKKASLGTFGDAAGFGEIIVIATLGTATEEVLKQAGPANFDGKLVLDTTNPLDFSGGMPPKLSISGNDSLGERVQKALPGAQVVKCFNTVGNVLMYKPKLKGGPPTMFIAGNNEDAKKQTTELLTQFGWGSVWPGRPAYSPPVFAATATAIRCRRNHPLPVKACWCARSAPIGASAFRSPI